MVYKCEEDFPGPFPAVNSPSSFLSPGSLQCKLHCIQLCMEKAQRYWGCNPERGSKERRSTGGSTFHGSQETQSSDTVSSSISKISTAIGVVNICPISSQGLFSWVFVPCFLLSFFLFKEKFPVLIKLKLLAAWLVFNSFLPFFLPYCLSERIFSKQSHRVFISTL